MVASYAGTMTLWWNRLKRILASEANDAKGELDKLRDVVDKELTRKEREMAASPSERLDMILEDIEADHGRLAALEDELGTDSPASETSPPDREVVEEKPAAPTEERPAEPPRTRARLLGPGDVSTAPHFQVALEWVSARPLEADQRFGPLTDFDHELWIEEWVGSLVGEERFDELEAIVKRHPLVLDAIHEDREVLYVKAPGLHSEDVRLIVAAAFADHVPDDWKEQLGE